MEFISENLRKNNLKVTPQRIAIYEYLLSTKSHPTAETIYREILKDFPTISFATVYKTLDTLCKAGLILEFNVGEDSFRYDATVLAHPHFVCSNCSKVIDMDVPSSFDNFQKDISEINSDFNIKYNEMFFYGNCDSCE